MPSHIKKLLFVLGFTAVIFSVFSLSNALVIEKEEDEEDEECTLEECGEEDDEDTQDPIPPEETVPPPAEDTCRADTWSCTWSGCLPTNIKTASNCKLTKDCLTAETPAPTEITCRYIPPLTPTPTPTPTPSEPAPPQKCKADIWKCADWGVCTNKTRHRRCWRNFDCPDVITNNPNPTAEKCDAITPIPTPLPANCRFDIWTCQWSECLPTNIKTALDCELTSDCPKVNTPEPTKTVCRYIAPTPLPPITPQPPPVTPKPPETPTPPGQPAPKPIPTDPRCLNRKPRNIWTCDWNTPCESNTLNSTIGKRFPKDCKLTLECPRATNQAPEFVACRIPLPPPPPPPPPPPQQCTKDEWSCPDWGSIACPENGIRTRTCTREFDCPNADNSAETWGYCTPPAPPPPPPQELPELPPMTEDEAQAAEEARALEEAAQAAEEARIAEENARRAAEEEEARRRAEEQAQRETEEAIARQRTEEQALQQAIEDTPVFREIVEETAAAAPEAAREAVAPPTIEDNNQNGIPDSIDRETGISTQTVDREDVSLRAALEVKRAAMVSSGASPAQAEKEVKKIYKQKRGERKVKKIREVAKKKFKRTITKNTDDCNKDGIADDVAVALGDDPCAKAKPLTAKVRAARITQTEAKIFRANVEKFGEKISISLNPGEKVPTKGFSVLAACPANSQLTLYLINKNGKKTAVSTKPCSNNFKAVFTLTSQQLRGIGKGRYLAQIQAAKEPVALRENRWLASLIPQALAAETAVTNVSEPILIDVVEDTKLPDPIVKSIEGVDVTGSLRDIRVYATQDGRIHVAGVSDVAATVIGTFESAVFTSAILADIDAGTFEIASAEPLDVGDHEVVIFATRPEENIQSAPIKIEFSIVETARAAAENEEGVENDGTEGPIVEIDLPSEKPFPVIPVAVGGLIVLLVVIGLVVRKRKNGQSGQ